VVGIEHSLKWELIAAMHVALPFRQVTGYNLDVSLCLPESFVDAGGNQAGILTGDRWLADALWQVSQSLCDSIEGGV
jgi:hypothetical protein